MLAKPTEHMVFETAICPAAFNIVEKMKLKIPI
jgi:hypothetical protein